MEEEQEANADDDSTKDDDDDGAVALRDIENIFYSRSAHSVVFEIREKEYGQTRVKCLRKGVQTHSMGGASNSARAIMDNFTTRRRRLDAYPKRRRFFFFPLREISFSTKKKCAFRLDFYIYFTTSSTITLL